MTEFKQFFKERPSLSMSGFANEAGYSAKSGYLTKLLSNPSIDEVPAVLLAKLLPLMVKYGYKG